VQIEAVATKEELEHLALLCRSEADAMGRITAGILRLLKLDKSLGQGTIEQLRNLGMELPSSNLDDTVVHSLGFRFFLFSSFLSLITVRYSFEARHVTLLHLCWSTLLIKRKMMLSVVLQPCQNFRFSEHWQDMFLFMLKRTLDIAK